MDRNFRQQFSTLINESVSRSFLQSQENRHGRLNEADYGKLLDDYDELYPIVEDGFIACYCEEQKE